MRPLTSNLGIKKKPRVDSEGIAEKIVSRMAHELRTPLTSILGFSRMILREEMGELNADQREGLRWIVSSAERMEGMIDTLLLQARIDERVPNPVWTEVCILEEWERTTETFRLLFEKKEIPFLVKSPTGKVGKALKLECPDPLAFIEILQNLLSNAFKYTEKGMVTASLSFSKDRKTVEFQVKDSGIGMSARDAKRLFERFFRSQASLERGIPGTGLGLSQVKAWVDAMSGKIKVESLLGRGTTFQVHLPLKAKKKKKAKKK